MQPLSGSAGQPADHSPERSVPQSDQYCSMDASKLKAFPVDSSAVQPAHHPSDADGETITGDGSHKGDERQKEATSSYSNATGESAVSQEAAYSYNYWRHPTVGSITGGMCLECGWAITTRPWDVWWTTLLGPEKAYQKRIQCRLSRRSLQAHVRPCWCKLKNVQSLLLHLQATVAARLKNGYTCCCRLICTLLNQSQRPVGIPTQVIKKNPS